MYRRLLTKLLISAALHCTAQMPVLQHYGVDDGLPSSCVYRAFQDSKGLIWLMTSRGLSRFDGVHFQNYTMADGLPQNNIFLAGEDRHQRIWVYAYNHKFCYFDLNKNQFHTIPNTINIPKSGFLTHFIDTDTGMVVYGNSVVYKIDANERVSLLNSGWTLPINFPVDIPLQRQYPMITGERIIYHKNTYNDSIAWLQQGNDVPQNLNFNIDLDNYITTALADSAFFNLNGEYLECFYARGDTYRKGKYIKKKISQLANGYDKKNVQLCVVGGNTRYAFIRTNNDRFIVDENLNRVKRFDFINQLDVNGVNADNQGNFWICTRENGLYVLEKKVFKTIPVTQRTKTSIKALVKDKQGSLIMGNSLGEIHVLTNGIMRTINFDYPIKFPIKTLKILSDGRVFVAWDSKITILSPQQIYGGKTIQTQNFTPNNKLPNKISTKIKLPLLDFNFKSITVEPNNNIIVASFGAVSRLKDSANFWVTTELERSAINHALTNDLNGNIWIGKSSGLWLLKTEKEKLVSPSVLDTLTAFKKQYPILNESILDLAHDTKSHLWIATGVGLNMLKTDIPSPQYVFQNIKELDEDIVEHIFMDSTNKVWVATNKGIATLKITADKPFQYQFQRLNVNQWLPSQEINALLADSLSLYVGTSQGLSVIDLKQLAASNLQTEKLSLVIIGVSINKMDTVIQNTYNLSYNQNTIDIRFVAPCYKSEKNIRYQYRLLSTTNTDTIWHDVQDIHKEFAYLEPDKYRFYLKVSNNNNNFSSLAEPIIFNIDAPFWHKTWFLSLITLLIAGSIFTLYQRRIKKIETEEAAKTAMNKRFVELELHGLQAQMNPHFIFNALTAVQSFILHKDTHTANTYLTKFSKLMRQFLEASRRKFISLQDEIDLLNNYVSLEQVRFVNTFDFTCTVGANVDVGIEIPSMLFQPFIENAIIHGMLYKKEKGHISITFLKNGEGIQCIIEDDGVGRKDAARRQAQSLKPHTSRATQIMEERIQVLQQVEDVTVSIEIIDKMNGNNRGIGTKVVINIE